LEESNQNSIYRKQKLRDEGLIEIPMSIDPSRYFIGNIRWKDVLYTAPFAVISVILIVILNQSGNLNTSTFLFSFLPPIMALTFFWVKHPDRKNISFITTVWWKIQYSNSKKMYEFTKEVNENVSEDIRSQLGVFNIANDCLETLDNKLIKVIEVSSINLTGLSERERNRVYSNYQTFLNNYAYASFPIQTKQFSKPINLNSYLEWVRKNAEKDEDQFKRMFAESYVGKVNEIQKSKNMVSKARYIVLSAKIGSNKEKALQNINRDAEQLVSGLENMLSDRHKLHANILDNEKLFQYIYACIDYENAQIRQSTEREYDIDLPFSMGKYSYEDTLKKVQDNIESYESEIY